MGRIKLLIKAGKASMLPPVGPILGQYGIPGQQFCQDFNLETDKFKKDIVIRAILHQLSNKSISKKTFIPLYSHLIKKLIHSDTRTVDIRRVFQLAYIMAYFDNQNYSTKNIYGKCKTIISMIHSMHCTITK